MFPFQSGLVTGSASNNAQGAPAVAPVSFISTTVPASSMDTPRAAGPAVVGSFNPSKATLSRKRRASVVTQDDSSKSNKRLCFTGLSALSLNTPTSTSSFFSLPAEVQDMVLTNLFKGRILHINTHRDHCHPILKDKCWAHCGHSTAKGNTKTTSTSLALLPTLSYRNLQDATILHTCKELAEAGEKIIWKTSIYTFTKPKNLARFIEVAGPEQLSSIQNLRIIIDDSSRPSFRNHATGAAKRLNWNSVLTPQNIKNFSSLRSVHVDVCVKKNNPVFMQQRYDASFLSGLAEFATCKVSATVEVIIVGECMLEGLRPRSVPWTEEESARQGSQIKQLMEGRLVVLSSAA